MFLTRPDQIHDPLYIVTSVFNPRRFKTRWKLWTDFQLMVKASGAKLMTVEVAFGERDFVLKDAPHDYYLPLRTSDELWHKENTLNLGVAALPADWKYVAFIDADVVFSRDDWANELLHLLQHYKVVHPFSQSVDLGPNHEILNIFRSYAWCVAHDIPRTKHTSYYTDGEEFKTHYFHPGYGMAMQRETFDALGGLIDFAILGGADLWMFNILFNHDFDLPNSLGPTGKQMLNVWKGRADKYVKQNIGYMDTLLLHQFHGPKKARKYKDRGNILVDAKFDPLYDLKKDSQGLWQLNPDNVKLRDGIRKYMAERNEDSIDV